jgi:radical SAM protein with 4Fe4S-binding SPASM domain
VATLRAAGTRRHNRPFRRIAPNTCFRATMVSTRRTIADAGLAGSCYFRTSTVAPDRKALVQITERCNLHCAHCFVSAVREGKDIPRTSMRDLVLPRLAQARVRRLTLTGGEPFAHPDVLGIVEDARALGMSVTLCTNGTLIEPESLDALAALGGVRLNVSLDGFSRQSHGRFRGAPDSFEVTKRTLRAVGEHGLLKGVLVTPNGLAPLEEYEQLCNYARECGAEYVLMNPLSPLGRGVRGMRPLGASERFMRELSERVSAYESDLDIVRIRFPNDERPLSGCEAGTIMYVFAGGEVTVCPYLVFAARTPGSRHDPAEFIVGNIFQDADIAARMDSYRLHNRARVKQDPVCGGCAMAGRCGRGCPAAVIAAGGRLGERDREQCPVPDSAQAVA